MGFQENGLSESELAAQDATALPDKEVVSILDLNADLALAIDAAAPIDLAVAANANVAAPIDASVGANVLSMGSTAQALSDQGTLIDQNVSADATAHAMQDSTLDQTHDTTTTDPATTDPTTTDPTTTDPTSGTTDPAGTTTTTSTDPSSVASGDLPNVAAPIDASVAANVGSVDSAAVSVAQQDAIINQNIEGAATATSDQQSDISQ